MSKKQTVTAAMYEVLRKPLVTEKTALIAEGNVVTFEVAPTADKPAIKEAVEAIYGVKVERVNTLNQAGKVKRFKGFKGQRSDVKKAMIKLADGHSIDVSAGL